MGKKIFQFPVQLGGQGLVGSDNQCGFLNLGNNMGHGKGLAGACDAEQDLMVQAPCQPLERALIAPG